MESSVRKFAMGRNRCRFCSVEKEGDPDRCAGMSAEYIGPSPSQTVTLVVLASSELSI